MYLRVKFHDKATKIGNGINYVVDEYKTLTVGIMDVGFGSTAKIEFHGVDEAGNDNLIKGLNLATWSGATSTSDLGETWSFDITGLVKVYFAITAISGTVTIAGRAVA